MNSKIMFLILVFFSASSGLAEAEEGGWIIHQAFPPKDANMVGLSIKDAGATLEIERSGNDVRAISRCSGDAKIVDSECADDESTLYFVSKEVDGNTLVCNYRHRESYQNGLDPYLVVKIRCSKN